jgi:hypothetical protein
MRQHAAAPTVLAELFKQRRFGERHVRMTSVIPAALERPAPASVAASTSVQPKGDDHVKIKDAACAARAAKSQRPGF